MPYLPQCYKRTKNTCHRAHRKASSISMIQTLNFETSSRGKQQNMMTEQRHMKPRSVQLHPKIEHLNKNHKIFQPQLNTHYLKRENIYLLHFRKYETDKNSTNRIAKFYFYFYSLGQSQSLCHGYIIQTVVTETERDTERDPSVLPISTVLFIFTVLFDFEHVLRNLSVLPTIF